MVNVPVANLETQMIVRRWNLGIELGVAWQDVARFDCESMARQTEQDTNTHYSWRHGGILMVLDYSCGHNTMISFHLRQMRGSIARGAVVCRQLQ